MTEKRPKYKANVPRVSEHDEQANFFSAARFIYGARDDFSDDLFFSVPNGLWAGGDNKFALMSKFKKEGMKRGVSDILYLQPRGGFAYLVIEMKAQDRRGAADAVSDDQWKFLDAVERAGGLGAVCYGCDEAMQVLNDYMLLEPR